MAILYEMQNILVGYTLFRSAGPMTDMVNGLYAILKLGRRSFTGQ